MDNFAPSHDPLDWTILHLIIIYLIGQVLRVYLESIEMVLKPILDDFLLEKLPWYMPTWTTTMPMTKVEN